MDTATDQAIADAQAAYQAYGDDAQWLNFRGGPMPTWPDLPKDTRRHWVAAASAVRARVASS